VARPLAGGGVGQSSDLNGPRTMDWDRGRWLCPCRRWPMADWPCTLLRTPTWPWCRV